MYSYFFWGFLAYICYRMIVVAIENERITKVAKIEAKLKQELSQRYTDPAAVERIMSSKLADPQLLQYRVEHEVGSSEDPRYRVQQMEGAAQHLETSTRKSRGGSRDGHLLFGLIFFLTGLAFCGSAFIVAIEALYIPGFLLAAVGLGMLTFATYQQELSRGKGGEQQVS